MNLPNTLNKIECYRCSWNYDKVDARFTNFEYFSTKEKAEKRKEKIWRHTESSIDKVALYIDECDNIYKIQYMDKVGVDLPSREDILAKLTEKEKFVLGIK